MPAATTIAVGAAGKVGDGVNAYYVFPVTSTAPGQEPLRVDRRYSDFLWLHHQMSKHCAGFIIPPLPAKVVGFLQGPEFLEQRRAGLERFLRKLAAHAELRASALFTSFLECSVVELTALKAESSSSGLLLRASSLATPRGGCAGDGADSPASSASFASPSATRPLSRQPSFSSGPTASLAAVAQHTQQLQSWWGKACQRLAENRQLRELAARAGRELPRARTIEDAAFAADVQYLADLGAQLRRLKAKVRAAHQQNQLAAGSYCDLIETLGALADAEDARGEMPAGYFSAMLALLDARARQMDGELDKLAARIDGLGRWVKAVQRAVAVREDRRLHLQALLAARPSPEDEDQDVRKTTGGGGGGGPEDKTDDEPHQPLSDELLAAKDEFEQVHARVAKEIARFRAEKAAELRKMFQEFAALQLRGAAELGDVLAASTKALDAPLPPSLRASAGSASFYDSGSSVGSSSGDETNVHPAKDEDEAPAPAPVPTKTRVPALSGAVAKAKASLAGASEPSYSDVRL